MTSKRRCKEFRKKNKLTHHHCQVLELEKRAMEGSTNAERVTLPYSASAVDVAFREDAGLLAVSC